MLACIAHVTTTQPAITSASPRKAATSPAGGRSRSTNTSYGMKRIAPANAAMKPITATRSADGCPRWIGGAKRAARRSGFVRASSVMLATAATKNTRTSTHAAGHAKSPGG